MKLPANWRRISSRNDEKRLVAYSVKKPIGGHLGLITFFNFAFMLAIGHGSAFNKGRFVTPNFKQISTLKVKGSSEMLNFKNISTIKVNGSVSQPFYRRKPFKRWKMFQELGTARPIFWAFLSNLEWCLIYWRKFCNNLLDIDIGARSRMSFVCKRQDKFA